MQPAAVDRLVWEQRPIAGVEAVLRVEEPILLP